jgi:hypothetical protein
VYVFNPELAHAPFPLPGVTTPLYPDPDPNPPDPDPNHGNLTVRGLWAKAPFVLQNGRYYPTAMLTHRLQRTQGREVMLVPGGGLLPGGIPPTWNNYEAVRIDAGAGLDPQGIPISGLSQDSTGLFPNQVYTWAGPGTNVNNEQDWLNIYPWMHLLTNGRAFFAGAAILGADVDHETTFWNIGVGRTLDPAGWNLPRYYGTSLRYPNTNGNDNRIVRMGGFEVIPQVGGGSLLTSTETVEACQADVSAAPWQALPSMTRRRAWLNAVILPDASIVAFGGADLLNVPNQAFPAPGYPGAVAHYVPEILTAGASSWSAMTWAPAQSVRDYHFTSLLLPSGRVLVAGGNNRGIDYELFEPPYMGPSPGIYYSSGSPVNVRIVGQQPAGFDPFIVQYDPSPTPARFTVRCDALPFGVFLQKVVLMAPGSTTHHNDMSQRYHQLAVTISKNAPSDIQCTPPANDLELLRGFYMLFTLTNTGRMGAAIWVRMQ